MSFRRRTTSNASSRSSVTDSILADQELDSLYDYLAKIILLGPSGCGKSCILHRFVRSDWKVLSSQTIGVEFSSKIVKVGHQEANKRGMKLQLWDTAGQERFKSLTRGYYRGSAGVVLVYDITNRESFEKLGEFLADVRALTSPNVSIVVLANKADLERDTDPTMLVELSEAQEFCFHNNNLTLIQTSALTGENVQEAFNKLASMILTKIELGEIDPEDNQSGVQYGEIPRWDHSVSRSQGRSFMAMLGGRRQYSQRINLDGRRRTGNGSSYGCC